MSRKYRKHENTYIRTQTRNKKHTHTLWLGHRRNGKGRGYSLPAAKNLSLAGKELAGWKGTAFFVGCGDGCGWGGDRLPNMIWWTNTKNEYCREPIPVRSIRWSGRDVNWRRQWQWQWRPWPRQKAAVAWSPTPPPNKKTVVGFINFIYLFLCFMFVRFIT